ncbi:hypothetical protein ACFOY4_22525 [Actinomadura syzygii]|uniref:Uncharacterized protein n=1 Tax=Actinomadura syzygii TaxID=1427538 RepID=A0A5D0UJR0_9ACTN|nr:hypothetical protein [Actinomadura syzygii]TYC18761.1 hypothetical protein FXF65_03195 [Actinomadura syzygii]
MIDEWGDTWPTIQVWVINERASVELSFTPLAPLALPDPSTPPFELAAPLSDWPAALARLGSATRAAVCELTGVHRYEDAVPVLYGDNPPQVPRGTSWPKLPYIAERDSDGQVERLTLGAPKYAENGSRVRGKVIRAKIPGASVVPFPSNLEVVRALDLAVKDAAYLLTGHDDEFEARKDLNAQARAQTPRDVPLIGPARPNWWTGGPTQWTAQPKQRTPDWSEAGPRTVSGGAPGLGKRRR